ncbi:hypothetical protein ACFSJY_13850 [Thalassotalea euphylliae]|uniref:hypothetical protein n=1 Tax=Thalassotalea euphylliae TaxID=1655234 RepID=UPI00362C6934
MKKLSVSLLLIAIFSLSFSVNANERKCGSLDNHFGPFDYYDPANHQSTGAQSQGKIRIVTKRHLTKSMLRLKRGSTGSIADDLDYTLRAIPNHPKGLDLASRFELERKNSATFAKRHKKLFLSADCYFERAMRFQPEEGETAMIYGIHKHRFKQYDQAVVAYKKAERLGLDNIQLSYNLALSYVAMQNYEAALPIAKQVYAEGFPLDGLKNKLISAGVWQ